MSLPPPVLDARRLTVGPAGSHWGTRTVPEETAVALTYNQATYAVMMATPQDLEDFGYGFSLTEGVAHDASEITALSVMPHELGLEVRISLTAAAADRTAERRRRLAGPVGCGLCGVESLTEALRPLPGVQATLQVTRAEVQAAMAALGAAQPLNARARALHAAGFWRPGAGLIAVREDVGRHNALDKLAGALARTGQDARDGIVVISSRVSVEMVQKAVVMGAPILAAVSAPTALAVRTASAAGLTLIAVARDDGFEIFSAPQRVPP